MKEPVAVTASLTVDDIHLKRRLGYWSLVAIGVGSVIGSGWLFAAMYAAQAAGPSSLIGWVVGGLIMLALALVNAELGRTHPESGGSMRYPLYSNGKLAAGIIGWCTLVAVIGIPALEAAGVMQYASEYIPGLFVDGELTPLGILAAAILLGVFMIINFFGVKLFSESNNVITFIKVFVPTLTIVMLIASGFTGANDAGGLENFTSGGGFAPFGLTAPLSIIATGGILFAYNGAQVIVHLSGEAKNPRRNIPAAMVTTILFTIFLYVGLQLAFIMAVPTDMLANGWRGVDFDSPFANIAMLMGMSWLYWMLLADASISPTGSAIIGVASNARNTFALAKNRFLPAWLQNVDDKWGVPRRALVVNYLVGLAFLLPMPSWHAIIGVVGMLIALTFGIAAVSAGVFRKTGVTTSATRIRGVGILAPITFAAGGLVVSWVPWNTLMGTIPIVAIGLAWYAVTYFAQKHEWMHVRGGIWLIVYFAFLYVACFVGSFGIAAIPAPWDSVLVAIGSVLFYWWGVHEGGRFMSANPQIAESMLETTSANDAHEAEETRTAISAAQA